MDFRSDSRCSNHAGEVLMVDHELHVIVGLELEEERQIVILVLVVIF